jgi:Domain of unknown function (DUF4411)
MNLPARYCFDTSGFLDGWTRYYAIRRFPTLWTRVAELFTGGRAVWPEEVWAEIREADLIAWLAGFRYCEVASAAVWTEARRVQQAYNPQQYKAGINGADSFVIAVAKTQGLTIISGEVRSNGLPKIPNICDREGIDVIKFTELLDREGWTF